MILKIAIYHKLKQTRFYVPEAQHLSQRFQEMILKLVVLHT